LPASEITLCFPDDEKTCFGCCPPIRPAGYDHLEFKPIIARILRENTSSFKAANDRIIPITGFSCWALGYLDQEFRLVGCLLHPARNNGKDLRYRVDFGNKCRRETCEEARIFNGLSSHARQGCLGLIRGMDSFRYSSRRENPIFRMLQWGTPLLEVLWSSEKAPIGWNEFIQRYPFFSTALMPKAHAYTVTSLVLKFGMELLRENSMKSLLEAFALDMAAWACHSFSQTRGKTIHTHLLTLPGQFLDFLRLGARLAKISPDKAVEIKNLMDRRLDEAQLFVRRLQEG
jgi:hypothetical protein